MSRTSVCHFYQAGSCRNGVTCPFGHPTVRCRTFTSTGWCPYGYNCYFWHDCSQARVLTTTFKRKSCIFFANNQCKYGDACAFSHDLESQNHSSAMTLAEYRSSKILSPQTFLQQPNVTKRLQPVHDVACVGEGRSSTTVTPPMKITSLPNTILTPNPNKVATHFRINETNEADICHLQNIEIERMLKSFPADKLCEVQSFGDGRTFCLKFSSTDPDWAYDVREITINVHIRPMYPLEPLRITVLSNEYLPDLLVEYLNKAVESWIASKHKELSQTDRKGLYLRLFFRWLDRNLEDLFTEALRK
ncbi:hypothetical protein PHET_12271 [Paragonimus heterotremus]|uniref:C3H1-type domain-containing protein n=1 Tax=Paragonimus heterotremus TaxID=100268 RepID=A0A8J4SMW5_9TREM|nr:hypothetical protein PHET_12271 [Paragonimus heterotremus]